MPAFFFSGAQAKSSKIPLADGPFSGIDPNPDPFFTNSAQSDSLKPLAALQNLLHHRTNRPATTRQPLVPTRQRRLNHPATGSHFDSLRRDSLEDPTSIETSGRQ